MRFPNDTQRHAIYGKTGSGKTIAGLWALERRDFKNKRWEILDFKRDNSIAKIPRLEELGIDEPVSKKPGLYVRRPMPGDHDAVEKYLWRLWERGKCGLMVDEGYEINRLSKAWRSVLTQGRSLRIPVITLSQRPAWLSPFLMSEMDFHQVFFMQNPQDLDKISEWVPGIGPLNQDYHSYYYDVAKNDLTYLAPVPGEDEIMNRFDSKMPRRIHLFRGITSNALRRKNMLTRA
jgi:hypothetical protein